MTDIQKAAVSKRISALLLDALLIVVLTVILMTLLSKITRYDSYADRLEEYYNTYEERYGIDFDILPEDYEKLTDAEKAVYDEAKAALESDPDAVYDYNTVINLTLFMISVSLFLSFAVFEFVMPLVFGNGMTVGKKVFGLAVMRTNSVKAGNAQIFVRSMLGKFTFETMIPVLIAIMIYFGTLGGLGFILLFGIAVLQTVFIIVTKKNQAIHDLLADTVVVDFGSQNIFPDEESLNRYLEDPDGYAGREEEKH